jgi:hypothetical protein
MDELPFRWCQRIGVEDQGIKFSAVPGLPIASLRRVHKAKDLLRELGALGKVSEREGHMFLKLNDIPLDPP